MGRNVQSTIPIIASMKMMPKESKKAKRSMALAKRSNLEAIRVNWQREVNRSSMQTSSLDHRTRSKSKSSSSKLLQNSLEDSGSIKLSILVDE
jgi:formylmethanofuran dehydrogenase subunit E